MGEKKTILIVDDDKIVNLLLADLFSSSGYQVVQAFDGHEALEKVKEANPDVVLLDTVMPGMDGIAVCHTIKKEWKRDTKVILYTGKIDAVNAARAKDAGADEYLVKSEDVDPLVMAVKKAA